MTTPTLNPTELDVILNAYKRYDLPGWCGLLSDKLRDHVAVLEQERDSLAARLDAVKALHDEVATSRDEALRTGKQFETDMRKHFEQSCANLQRAEKVERERDAAIADNAVLMEVLGDVAHRSMDTLGGMEAHDRAVRVHAQPHPGADLLETHHKEIAYYEDHLRAILGAARCYEEKPHQLYSAIRRIAALSQDPVAVQQMDKAYAHHDEHRRALVRARNQGLEKAASAAGAYVRDADDGVPLDPLADAVEGRIRALKEPET